MPVVDAFLDSNVLLYVLSEAPSERSKHKRSAELIARTNFGLSYQVLMEVYVTATRKYAVPVAEDKVARFLEALLAFPCADGSPGLFREAVVLSKRFRIHPYDAAMLAAARELEAPVVYSEDMSHGQDYDGVRVLNPFV
jgi:predicted nucleic acid-binding protein